MEKDIGNAERNFKLNKLKPFKPWLENILNMFIDYDPAAQQYPDEIDQLIINSGVRDIKLSNGIEMTKNDWVKAEKIMGLLEGIFGGYAVKKMLTGTLLMDEYIARYTIMGWRKLHEIYTDLEISLPHNGFTGVVPSHHHSGFDAINSIQQFIIDSIISPWKIDGHLLIQGIPTELFNPIVINTLGEAGVGTFYKFLSELTFNQYQSFSKNFEIPEKNYYYAKLGNILIDILKTQVYRNHLYKYYVSNPNIVYDLTKSEILLYQKLGIQCILDCLYSTRTAKDVRRSIYEFLTSGGRKEVLLDFSLGRYGRIFGENYPLSRYTSFYKIELTWESYISLFSSNWAEMANSIIFDIESTPSIVRDRSKPQNIIGRDRVIEIAKFLKDIAVEYGDGKPIRIYGFQVSHDGYGTNYHNKKIYFPVHDDPVIDVNMPASNQWYYEIDPNNLDSFSLEHFRVFLGALFADHQGFFVRLSGMGPGEFLFAFDAQGALTHIRIASSGIRPTTPSNPLHFIDPKLRQELNAKWNEMVEGWREDNMISQSHRFELIEDWHNFLKELAELDEQKSSFESLISN